MGLDIHGTKSLMYAKTQGVRFTRTAMIGRQELHLSADALGTSLLDFGYLAAANAVNDLIGKAGGFAEPLLEALGAIEICSFDSSEYEGASNVHDFNSPIDESLKNSFTAVIDGGTLEHIFNFPVAIKNCMELVEVGGHFIGITPTNNWGGHGFYQFSPELFFRIFSETNGFRIVRMIMFENRPEADWFEVADPDAIKERVSLVNAHATTLLVLAAKVASVQIFTSPPQQSDYVALWKLKDTKTEAGTPLAPASVNGRHWGKLLSRVAHRLFAFAPAPVKSLCRGVRYSLQSQVFSNPRFFRRMQIP
jgi:hypothetical protein